MKNFMVFCMLSTFSKFALATDLGNIKSRSLLISYGKPFYEVSLFNPIYATNGRTDSTYSMTVDGDSAEITIRNGSDCTMVFAGGFFKNDNIINVLDFGNGFELEPGDSETLNGRINTSVLSTSDRLTFKPEGYFYNCQ